MQPVTTLSLPELWTVGEPFLQQTLSPFGSLGWYHHLDNHETGAHYFATATVLESSGGQR
jgi:hypothetical protein